MPVLNHFTQFKVYSRLGRNRRISDRTDLDELTGGVCSAHGIPAAFSDALGAPCHSRYSAKEVPDPHAGSTGM